MIIFIFSVLIAWLIISIISAFILFCPPKKNFKIQNCVESKINSKKILESQPKIRAVVKEIVRLEKLVDLNPENETLKTRLCILRAKLKISIRNPVVRLALIDFLKNK